MENLQQQFLKDSVSNLENLCSKLSNEPPTEDFLREIFRLFHTLKGTSQTFNFHIQGKLAHRLEDLLHAFRDRKTQADEKFVALLREGAEILCAGFKDALAGRIVSLPIDFLKKLQALLPGDSETADDFLATEIPPDIFKQLSVEEKKTLSTALEQGKEFYAIAVGFDLQGFAERFRRLKKELQKRSRIIATFPHPALAVGGKIGFRIFFAGRKHQKEFTEIANSFGGHLTTFGSATAAEFTGNPAGVIAQAVAAGEKTARRLGKNIEFEKNVEKLAIPIKGLKIVSDILLHLVRNAVDHAIATKGKIKIELSSEKNAQLCLRVSDNGRGLDENIIRQKATRNNLIPADAKLTREETFDLIFAHGFSTRDEISETSGRGVGLDVVRDAVEKERGTIRVASEPGKGTVFEVFLPKEF